MAEPAPLNLNEYIPILESIMRITLAGFGGAMAGLSISRRAALSRTTSALLTNPASTKRKHAIHRHHPLLTRSSNGEKGGASSLSPYAMDRELPAAWAMACMSFTGVIEFTRFVSPAGALLDFVSRVNDGGAIGDSVDAENNTIDSSGNDTNQDSFAYRMISGDVSWLSEPTTKTTLESIADYTIGGAIGGALFSGSAVRTRAGRKIDASILGTAASRGARPLSGLLPGAGLGLLAGVVIVSVDLLLEFLEENFGDTSVSSEESSDVPQAGDAVSDVTNDQDIIPAHIKSMSNEELARSIDDLKRRKV
ncbi:hypothetical protein HJC23_012143 [Cyclotella cryptica]|uniref:Uncharacterized protein n=1 Tax=Cyclotella cryptica TaxID=29204 RepID=A0ABD3PIY6_9STRA|eukprot:CCRYP_014278-RA/>CCRYP_014278-RA protein AED:0.43 eAED:0.43 QI:0/-1/0/1/-1/1/1/0/307